MAAKEKKGLGTGLGILFGEDAYTDENELKLLPLGKLEPRQTQPRSVFDDEALQELAESVKRYGVIQPVTARRLPSGYYQIIAGERRWRAARLAGLEEVPVRVIEADDRRTAELALVENLQRQDLNPMEEARGYQSLMQDFGLTQEETARSVAKALEAQLNQMLDSRADWRRDVIQMRALEAPLKTLRGEARWQVFIKMYARSSADEVISQMELLERQPFEGARVELEVNPSAML